MSGFYPEIYPDVKSTSPGDSYIAYTRLIADLETPVSAMLKLMGEDEPCFLLESVLGGETRGRYSIIGLKPDLIWRCHKEKAEVCRDVASGTFEACEGSSIEAFKRLLAEVRMDVPEELPPMAGGLIGYFGYDMIKLVEVLPSDNPDPIGIPDACLMRPGILVIFDTVDGVITITAPVWADKDKGISADERYTHACERIHNVVKALQSPLSATQEFHNVPAFEPQFTANLSRETYFNMVEDAKEYIRAGDIFQVVLAQRFSAPFHLSPFALYRSLRYLNPSPFLFYLRMEGFSLIGSSPEILVRVRDDTITIRPIAGTRTRGKTREEDAALEADLLADPKEIAEHLMLLDLGRNDVGRCAETGTVKVTEEMMVERYSHVMHIVSNVEGKLDPAHSCFDALMSGFPAGTVSGAPKIRAMEIIDELEPEARSFYAGCVGYFSADGSMDTCITLRTGLVKDDTLYVQAGGGIVADSTPEGEYQESLNKARALMRAAEFASKFA